MEILLAGTWLRLRLSDSWRPRSVQSSLPCLLTECQARMTAGSWDLPGGALMELTVLIVPSDTWSGLQELCLAPPHVTHPIGLLKLGILGSEREDTAQSCWNSLNVLSFWASYISHLIDRALGEDWEYSSQHNKDGFSGGGWFCSRRDDYFNTIKNEQYEFGHLQP